MKITSLTRCRNGYFANIIDRIDVFNLDNIRLPIKYMQKRL